MSPPIARIKQIRKALGWDLSHSVALARGEASVSNGVDLLTLITNAIAETDEAYTRGRLEGYREGVEAIKTALQAAEVEVVEVGEGMVS